MQAVNPAEEIVIIVDEQNQPIGAVTRKIMRQQRRYTDFNNLRDRIFESGSYEEALAIIGEEVELVDIARE